MDYIENRCDGAAMSHLAPRRRKDTLRPFTTGEEMFDLLERVYGDPNRQHTAMNKFRALRMKDKDFNTFWAEFLRLAADLDHGDATLISELTYKLTPSLRCRKMIRESLFDQSKSLYLKSECLSVHSINAFLWPPFREPPP